MKEIVSAINEAPHLATYIYNEVDRQFGSDAVNKVKEELRRQDGNDG